MSRWYAINSVIPEDIRPERREAGGGVTADMLVDTREEASEQCISYLKNRIRAAERQIRKIEQEKGDE